MSLQTTTKILKNVVITTSTVLTAKTKDMVQADCSTGNLTITLPLLVETECMRLIVLRKNAGANVITIVPQSGTINGQASFNLTTKYQAFVLYNDGTEWVIPQNI